MRLTLMTLRLQCNNKSKLAIVQCQVYWFMFSENYGTYPCTHITQAEEQKLEAAEKYLKESAIMFDEFVKENDRNASEAIRM